ncbi:MAG: serine/threonine protein kinase [Anaerolineae bacterium]|nr:serine/threonine protein kinase [Anaerolineae bacterium]
MTQLLRPGTVLRERYEVLSCVGQGGMGAVYRAADLRLEGRVCALKEIRPDPDLLPEALSQAQRQFHREASVLARLDHPNLPKVSDYFTAGEREYLVMDFVAGRDLRQVLEEERRDGRALSEARVLQWAEQLCDALAYLHSQDPPILHRDIKPANVKESPGGLVKLVDFGLVKLLATDDARTITVLQGRGTIAYTPLEQYGGDTGHTGVRSDIYALGATLYHLLTGQPPADAKQRFLQPSSLISPRVLNPHISLSTERAILAAIAMHPDDRPATVEELRQMCRDTSLSNAFATIIPPHSEWQHALRANRALFFLVGGLLLLATLLTIFL